MDARCDRAEMHSAVRCRKESFARDGELGGAAGLVDVQRLRFAELEMKSCSLPRARREVLSYRSQYKSIEVR